MKKELMTHRFIATEDTKEPDSSWNGHIMFMQEVEEVMSFSTMRYTLSKLLKGYVWIREVLEPCLPLPIV